MSDPLATRQPMLPGTASTSAAPDASHSHTRRWSPSAIQLVVALTVLGGILRFATLNVSSIELDESATLYLVHRGFSGMLSHLSKSESAPPLYYILVWAWTKVFGSGPVGFRSFSAFVGTLTIPVMYLAGRQISQRVGVWAALLATLSPGMYFYSQEARCYALLVFFSACAFVAWQRVLQEPGGRRLALWALLSGLALLTHYFAAFLFIGEAVVLFRRLGWRRTWAPVGVVVLVGLALVPLAASQRSGGKTNWIEEQSLPRRVAESIKLFTVGIYGPLVLFALVIAVLIVAGAFVLALKHADRRQRAVARDATIVAGVAIGLPLLLAATHLVDVYDGRNVIAFWIPFAVLVASGVGLAGAHRSGAVLGGALCAIYAVMIVAANVIPEYQRDNWRGAGHALGKPAGARLIVAEAHAAVPLSLYMGPLSDASSRVPAVREVDFLALRHLRTVGAPQAAVVPTTPPKGFRLAGVTHTETFAIARFLAARATAPNSTELNDMSRISRITSTEVILQR